MLVNGRASSSVTRQLASSSAHSRGRRAFQAAPSLQLRSARTFAVAAEAPLLALKDAPLQPVMEKGELQLHKMTMAGIYAVYAYTAMPPSIQYIGLSRKVRHGSADSSGFKSRSAWHLAWLTCMANWQAVIDKHSSSSSMPSRVRGSSPDLPQSTQQ